jgi:uncharacterized protein
VDRAIDLRSRAEAWLRGAKAGPLAEDLAVAAGEPWWPLAFLPDAIPDGSDAEAVRRDLAEEMFFDPRPVFARVRVPTLLFYGDDDSWTPVAPSIAAWRDARGDAVEIVLLPGTGHEPTLAPNRISPSYEAKLVEWAVAQS